MACKYMTEAEELAYERLRARDQEKAAADNKKSLDEVTAILCGLMKKLEKNDMLDEATEKAKKWFKNHKKVDDSRKKK